MWFFSLNPWPSAALLSQSQAQLFSRGAKHGRSPPDHTRCRLLSYSLFPCSQRLELLHPMLANAQITHDPTKPKPEEHQLNSVHFLVTCSLGRSRVGVFLISSFFSKITDKTLQNRERLVLEAFASLSES